MQKKLLHLLTNNQYLCWSADGSGTYTINGRRCAFTCVVAILSPALVYATVVSLSIVYDELSRTMSGTVLNHDISDDL